MSALAAREKKYEKGERYAKGLRLVVQPTGKKTWRYTWARGKCVALGDYSTMSLSQARAEVPRVN
ncbi:MAG: Arm DNA-binding domain-containing protein, partial [Pseudomonadales bacterium]